MNCQKVLKLLPLYISDDLKGPVLSGVESHLNGCLTCFREYQTHLKALRALKNLGDKPDLSTVLQDFSAGVMEEIGRDRGGPAAPVPRVIHRVIPRFVAAAAVLLILVMGAFSLFGPDEAKPLESADSTIQNGNISPAPLWLTRDEDPFRLAKDQPGEGSNPWLGKGLEKKKNRVNPLHQTIPVVHPVGFTRDL